MERITQKYLLKPVTDTIKMVEDAFSTKKTTKKTKKSTKNYSIKPVVDTIKLIENKVKKAFDVNETKKKVVKKPRKIKT